MKKKLIILAMCCLLAPLSANAANWVAIDSGSDDIQAFIDDDSIKYIQTDLCTYALLYKKGNESAKVIYLKSDYSTDKVGIIRTDTYAQEHYNPGYYSKHTRTIMKEIKNNTLLNSAHNYALATYSQKATPYISSDLAITNISNTSNYLPDNNILGISDEEYNAYIQSIKSKIHENWVTSLYTANSNVNLIISINSDGSYNGYRILQSKADERAKRSALSAVNLSAPFAPFPENSAYVNTINIPVSFEQKLRRKYVK